MNKSVIVPAHVQERVYDEVDRCLKIAEQKYGCDFEFPTIDFDLRGRVAGKAFYKANRISLNSILLMENLDTFIDGRTGRGTVTHETAHLVDYIAHNGVQRIGQRYSLHGERWKRIMKLFGVRKPSRCHSYDTTNSRVRRSRLVKHEYRCNGCSEIMRLGPKRHRQQQNLPLNAAEKTVYWKRGCGRHAKKVGYTYLGPTNCSEKLNKASEQKTKHPLPKHGTKLERALEIVRENWHKDRDIVATRILNACNMSYQGAQTYYYKARKIAEAN